MSRKKKPLPLLENITITDLAAEGKALARINDMVVFVPYVVPGDIVDLQVKRKKHHYAEAEAVKFHSYSTLRVSPRCEHYGVCGGCKWQCLNYAEQIAYKQRQVLDNLTRIGKVQLPPISPILGCVQTYTYRNKLEFAFSNKKWLTQADIDSDMVFDNMNAVGFHIAGAFDKILDINTCHLMDNVCNEVRNEVRRYALAQGLSFFDPRAQHGLLRSMMIRNTTTRDLMLLMQFHYETEQEAQQALALMAHLHTTFPQITSLLYVNNLKCNDTIGDQEVITYAGEDHIVEEMEGLRFKVGPKSFYQTNSAQAYELYKVVRNFAQLTGQELVYDLYTGTGTIANFIARHARYVIGVEYVPEAIEDAKVNAAYNGLDNTSFFAGDMKDLLNADFVERHGHPEVIITDPPRAGMHADVIETIRAAAPQRIVYVSCNPATQARDLQLLDADYIVSAVQPVDMFPQTHHVENVVLLTRRTAPLGER